MRQLTPFVAALALTACAASEFEEETLRGTDEKFLTTDAAGRKALPADTTAEVWKVTTIWGDTTSAAAKAAGIAWPANSGLRWDEKFARWVDSMPAVTGASGFKTFTFTTPYGKTLQMPALECSEQALMLRAIFASWYGLPFFVEGSAGGKRVFLGHFGFRTAAGRYGSAPNFANYADYSSRGSSALSNWPHDTRLAAKHLTDSDGNDWIAAGAGFGAFADEALLNKRVGWFLLYLLDYFGSMNLADNANAYPLKPEKIRTGDFLLERWQKIGIGHTLIVKSVTPVAGGKLGVTLTSGSMPRRQPYWQDAGSSRYYFLSDITGGPGNADDGSPYAALGGGLRRFRVTQNIGGWWVNNIPSWDGDAAIDHTNLTAIAARPAQFGDLLADVSPADKLRLITSQIDDARAQLRQHPASCTNRTKREAFFANLYQFMADQYGWDKAHVDRVYRNTEDYYYPELSYGSSPTCCWDSTTPQMASLVDRYNRARESTSAACLQPVPFTKANYPVFKAYATQIGEGASWLAWHEDETCSARNAADDAKLAQAAVDYCSIKSALDAGGR